MTAAAAGKGKTPNVEKQGDQVAGEVMKIMRQVISELQNTDEWLQGKRGEKRETLYRGEGVEDRLERNKGVAREF